MLTSFILRLVIAIPALTAMAMLATPEAPIPEVALVTDIASHEGRYLASLAPRSASWDGREGWMISLRDSDGTPVEDAQLSIEAWMPDEPGVLIGPAGVEMAGGGQYRVDHLLLEPAGWWNVKLAIAGVAGDSLAFNVVLP